MRENRLPEDPTPMFGERKAASYSYCSSRGKEGTGGSSLSTV
jgi:hypothetical protein